MSSSSKDYFYFDDIAFDDVKQLVRQPRMVIDRDAYRLQIHHTRLKTFTRFGCDCKACGRKANRFVAECHVGPNLLKWYFNPMENPLPIAHINLYGTDAITGEKFMMTSDHRVPRSLGGSDKIHNRVPLCETCNGLKGNDPDWLDDLPKNKHGQLVHRKGRQLKTVRQKKRQEQYYA